MKNKIILGTVQLGMPYGINNRSGRPPEKEALDILDFAFDNNIDTLDSADNYGEALQVIGKHRRATGRTFQIINKFKVDTVPLTEKLMRSLSILGIDSLACYMYHQFADYTAGTVRKELQSLKQRGVIQKIGVSVYSTDELATIIADADVNIVQLPVNILDLSAEKEGILMRAKKSGKEIHARSVFLQGLLVKDPASLQGNLTDMRVYLEKVRSLADAAGTTVTKLALNYILANESIDKVVLGVEQVQQLRENLSLVDPGFAADNVGRIEIDPRDRHLLNPVNWKI